MLLLQTKVNARSARTTSMAFLRSPAALSIFLTDWTCSCMLSVPESLLLKHLWPGCLRRMVAAAFLTAFAALPAGQRALQAACQRLLVSSMMSDLVDLHTTGPPGPAAVGPTAVGTLNASAWRDFIAAKCFSLSMFFALPKRVWLYDTVRYRNVTAASNQCNSLTRQIIQRSNLYTVTASKGTPLGQPFISRNRLHVDLHLHIDATRYGAQKVEGMEETEYPSNSGLVIPSPRVHIGFSQGSSLQNYVCSHCLTAADMSRHQRNTSAGRPGLSDMHSISLLY